MDTYSRLELHLQRSDLAEGTKNFSALVKQGSKSNPVIRSFKDDLLDFHDLRNSIVHWRHDGRPIADPLASAVAEFQRIADLVISPPKVEKAFQMPVETCDIGSEIGAAAKAMRAGDWSQLPVVDGGHMVGLLTAAAIARWFGSVSGDTADMQSVLVRDVLSHTEDPKRHWQVISKDTSLAEALDAFLMAAKEGYRLDALIITHAGKSDQKPMGIVTVTDIPTLGEAVGTLSI